MKKALAILLSALLLIMTIPLSAVSVSATVVENGLKFRIGANEAIVVGYTAWPGKHLTIPDTIRDCPVIAIGANAFSGCAQIEKITLPHHLTIIGKNAFKDTAYYNNEANWENDVLYLGEYLIQARTSVSGHYTIKEGTVTLADNAFDACENLTGITFPRSLIAIGNHTFLNCDSLASVDIPDNVTVMGFYAFSSCDRLKSVTIGDGLTTIPLGTFSISLSLESVTFGANIKTIDTDAFYYCVNLTSISIPECVENIYSGAFSSCTMLKTVYISKNVSYIDDGAFADCMFMESIQVADDNPYYCSVDGVLFNKEMTSLIQYPIYRSEKTYVVPDGVTCIEYRAFDNCRQLVTVYLPASLRDIEPSAFSDYTGDNFYPIHYILYAGSEADLQNLYIGDKNDMLTAAEWVYNACLPDEHVFTSDCDIRCDNCTWERLHSLTSHTNENADVLHCDVCSSDILLYTIEHATAIITDFVANTQKHLEIPAYIENKPVIGIRDTAFQSAGLTSITLPSTLSYIEEDAFKHSTALTSVYIDDLADWCDITFANGDANPLSVAEKLYVNNKQITTLLFPNNRPAVFAYSFYGFDTLSTVFLPKDVTRIRTGAFDGCTKLTDVYYGGSEADRNALSIDAANQHLLNATWHYNTCNPDQHIYASGCDIQCEKCDWVRDDTTAHAYDTTCDTVCNLCGATRTIEHTYSAPCDPECNVCGAVRTELEHTYTNANDPDCNDCGARRETNYIYAETETPVVITKAGDYVDFVFVPAKTGYYEFVSSDTTAVVVCSIFDAATGENLYYFHGPLGFQKMCHLTGDAAYIVRVSYGFSTTGTFSMHIKPWEEGFYYSIANNQTVAIKGYLGTVPKVLAIPAKIEGLPVTTIASRAFYSVQRFTTLYIPGSVTYIGERAFADCDKLTTVFIENGLTTIEGNVFESCSKLTSVYLPASVTNIEIYAFYACNMLTDVYYSGSKQDKANMYICTTNTALDRATWHYNHVHNHTYKYVCQENCDVCGAYRTATKHTYNNGCDAYCNVCDAYRSVADHVYDAPCDIYCNECDDWRSAPAAHVFDSGCDDTCNDCGLERTARHTYEDVLTAPDCTNHGYVTSVCTTCGYSYVSGLNGLATGHSYDAACDADCNTCGATRQAGNHTYDNACDAACNACGATRMAFSHIYDSVCDATCNECGYTRSGVGHQYDNDCATTCSVCGAYREVYHAYEDVLTPPDCTNPGYTTYTCSVCGDLYIGDETPSLGHDYRATVTKPTCENGGYTTYTCSVCGDLYIGDETPSLGHDYQAVVTKPTCENGGYTTYTCSVCGDRYTDNPTSATGHVYDAACDADCNTCGAIREVPNFVFGDADGNGKVNNRDLGFLQQHLNGWNTAVNLDACDVDGNGRVNNRDLGRVQQYLNDWDVELG